MLERLLGPFRPLSPRLDSKGKPALDGRCNVCGRADAVSLYGSGALPRVAQLRALPDDEPLPLDGARAARGIRGAWRACGRRASPALPRRAARAPFAVYDTQVPFDAGASAYPIPTLLERCGWIDLSVSTWKPGPRPGERARPRHDQPEPRAADVCRRDRFDIVLTSDVMEHVRLERAAHARSAACCKPGGVYLFTVPHFRDRADDRTGEDRRPGGPLARRGPAPARVPRRRELGGRPGARLPLVRDRSRRGARAAGVRRRLHEARRPGERHPQHRALLLPGRSRPPAT